MAKKKTSKRKMVRVNEFESEPAPMLTNDQKGILAILAIILTVVGLIYWMTGPHDKFEYGDCALNRAFQPVKVVQSYSWMKTYELAYAKAEPTEDGWYLTRDWDRTRDDYSKSKKWVDATYIKIDCESKDIP